MREGRGRRTHPISWYIGSGNIASVFTRRAKSPFVRMKELYGNELERYHYPASEMINPPKRLSPKERLAIRNRVKAAVAKERQINYIIGIIIFIIVVAAIVIIKNLRVKIFDSL